MDEFWTLLRGVAVGLGVAIPVGPLALLIMRRTLDRGVGHGFATGVGAAVADGLYSVAAAYGIAAIADWVAHWQGPIRLVGGLVLLWFAVQTWRHAPPPPPIVRGGAEGHPRRLPGDFASGFVLAFTNPMTAVGFAAIFASFGLGTDAGSVLGSSMGDGSIGGGSMGGGDRPLALVLGVFLGSAGWWLALAAGVARVRHLISIGTLKTVNQAAACILLVSAIYALASATLLLQR